MPIVLFGSVDCNTCRNNKSPYIEEPVAFKMINIWLRKFDKWHNSSVTYQDQSYATDEGLKLKKDMCVYQSHCSQSPRIIFKNLLWILINTIWDVFLKSYIWQCYEKVSTYFQNAWILSCYYQSGNPVRKVSHKSVPNDNAWLPHIQCKDFILSLCTLMST